MAHWSPTEPLPLVWRGAIALWRPALHACNGTAPAARVSSAGQVPICGPSNWLCQMRCTVDRPAARYKFVTLLPVTRERQTCSLMCRTVRALLWNCSMTCYGHRSARCAARGPCSRTSFAAGSSHLPQCSGKCLEKCRAIRRFCCRSPCVLNLSVSTTEQPSRTSHLPYRARLERGASNTIAMPGLRMSSGFASHHTHLRFILLMTCVYKRRQSAFPFPLRHPHLLAAHPANPHSKWPPAMAMPVIVSLFGL